MTEQYHLLTANCDWVNHFEAVFKDFYSSVHQGMSCKSTVEGLYYLIWLLQKYKITTTITQCAKRGHQPLKAVFVDLAEAFDTVSHSHIVMSLKQKSTDVHIIALIKNLFCNITTQIDLKNEWLDPVRIWIGVKQGYPVSPVLFSLSVLYCPSWRRKAVGSRTEW